MNDRVTPHITRNSSSAWWSCKGSTPPKGRAASPVNRRLTANNMKTLTTLFLDQLADQYDAERRLVLAMPGMIKAATCARLQQQLWAHWQETKQHVKTLEKVFGSFGERPRAKQCEVTIGLLKESDEITASNPGAEAIDAGITFVAQRIERCEITSYGCLRDQAALLENREASGLLNEILMEEEAAHQALGELTRPSGKRGAAAKSAEAKPRTNVRITQPMDRPRGLHLLSSQPSRFSLVTF